MSIVIITGSSGLVGSEAVEFFCKKNFQQKNVSEIGNILNLDSGTLTPLLKRLEQKNIISRNRKIEDERVVTVTLTEVGVEMKVAAQCIPDKILEALNIDKEDLMELNKIVNKINIQLKK